MSLQCTFQLWAAAAAVVGSQLQLAAGSSSHTGVPQCQSSTFVSYSYRCSFCIFFFSALTMKAEVVLSKPLEIRRQIILVIANWYWLFPTWNTTDQLHSYQSNEVALCTFQTICSLFRPKCRFPKLASDTNDHLQLQCSFLPQSSLQVHCLHIWLCYMHGTLPQLIWY